jgi:hypothetical protein
MKNDVFEKCREELKEQAKQSEDVQFMTGVRK